jgi:transcriptional regulator with XRE-family HTH domain
MPNAKPLTQEEYLRLKIKPEDLGKLMTARRAARGLSQRQVAEYFNVSQSTIARWESGHIIATTVKMVNYLLDGEDSINEMWRVRALVAEATIKDILDVTREYRESQQLRKGYIIERPGGPPPQRTSPRHRSRMS